MNSDARETDTPEAAGAAVPAAGAGAEFDQMQARLRDTEAQHIRMAADFANFRKRARQEQSDASRYAAGRLAERLLPVLDNGERALQDPPAGVDENWLRGIELTFQKLEDELALAGVEPIEAVGSRFDPRLHEAVGSQESAEHREGTVLEELRRGYRIGDQVIRPSLVRIARRPVAIDTQAPER